MSHKINELINSPVYEEIDDRRYSLPISHFNDKYDDLNIPQKNTEFNYSPQNYIFPAINLNRLSNSKNASIPTKSSVSLKVQSINRESKSKSQSKSLTQKKKSRRIIYILCGILVAIVLLIIVVVLAVLGASTSNLIFI